MQKRQYRNETYNTAKNCGAGEKQAIQIALTVVKASTTSKDK